MSKPVMKCMMMRVQITELEPHPDAASFGADKEDRAALSGSMDDVGILDPVSVIEREPDLPGVSEDEPTRRGYWIIDGCGRVEAAKAAGVADLPCILWDLQGMSVREFAVHRNTMLRKVTTGQRILCYLSLNESAAIFAAERGTGRKKNIPSCDGISTALGCSDKDVSAALALFAAERAGEPGAREAYEGVLRGETPIRRWRAAAGGASATAGKAKAKTDIGNLALRVFTSLKTVFAGWNEIAPEARDAKYKKASEAFDLMPEDIATFALEAILFMAETNPRLATALHRASASLKKG